MSTPKPICVACGLFYHSEKNEVCWEEGMPRGPRGDEEWVPYKLWFADLWKCRGCGHEIIVGHAQQPFAEHYLPNYDHEKKTYPPYVRVNDC